MRFPPDFLDDIRARLPVSDVVGRRVKLRKQGREFAGLSPFNKEKTPSFFVNDQKGFYHCFSSGKHGDIFTFVMETEGVAFPEAVERLASLAGVPMPKLAPMDTEREKRRASLYDVMEMAAAFFQRSLNERGGANARAYLDRRGLSAETLNTFRIGYAPSDRTALKSFLVGQGVSVPDMVETGLLVSGGDIPDPFDRFRDRVMFPIQDMRGRIIAFGGRALQADVPAKYLNSPETSLFHKGAQLFNQHRARAAAHKAGTVVAVEGYMDVIALAQAGIDNAVAPLGTALTPEQLGLMWRMGPEPILCFDGDKAGQRAAWRAVDIALPLLQPGRSLRFAFLPEGQDPDDLVRTSGRGAADAVLEQALPLVDVLWMRETSSSALETPERRAAFEQRISALVGTVGDPGVRRHYAAAMEERLAELMPAPEPRRYGRGGGHSDGRGSGRFQRLPGGRAPALQASQALRASVRFPAGRMHPREAALVVALLNHPQLIDRHAEDFAHLELTSPDLDALRCAALNAAGHGEAASAEELSGALARAGLSGQLARAQAALPPGVWWALLSADDVDAETGFRHTVALHRKAHALHSELRAAELALGQDATEENFSRLVDIQKQLTSVEGTEASIEGFGAASGRPARNV